jgi:hypothetical protein
VSKGAHLYASLISACAIGKSGTPSKRLERARKLHAQMLGMLRHCVLAGAPAQNLRCAMQCHQQGLASCFSDGVPVQQPLMHPLSVCLHCMAAGAGVQTNVHVENQLMRVHCHLGDLAGAVAVLQVYTRRWCALIDT